MSIRTLSFSTRPLLDSIFIAIIDFLPKNDIDLFLLFDFIFNNPMESIKFNDFRMLSKKKKYTGLLNGS